MQLEQEERCNEPLLDKSIIRENSILKVAVAVVVCVSIFQLLQPSENKAKITSYYNTLKQGEGIATSNIPTKKSPPTQPPKLLKPATQRMPVQHIRPLTTVPRKQVDRVKSIFESIATGNRWGSRESISGTGSEIARTTYLSGFLNTFMREQNLTRIYDIPCGDANWQHMILGDDLNKDINEPGLL